MLKPFQGHCSHVAGKLVPGQACQGMHACNPRMPTRYPRHPTRFENIIFAAGEATQAHTDYEVLG
jgi:hypothetical protein